MAGLQPPRGRDCLLGLMLPADSAPQNKVPGHAASVESFWHKHICARTAFKRMKYYQLSWGE